MELQGMVSDMKQHQDRLLDTAAHLSNELGVNQEHVKVWEGATGVQSWCCWDRSTLRCSVE